MKISILCDVSGLRMGWRLDIINRHRSRYTLALVKGDTIIALAASRGFLTRASRRMNRHASGLGDGSVLVMTPEILRDAVIQTAQERLAEAVAAEGHTTRLNDQRAKLWPGTDFQASRIVNGGLGSKGAIAAKAALEDRTARIKGTR